MWTCSYASGMFFSIFWSIHGPLRYERNTQKPPIAFLRPNIIFKKNLWRYSPICIKFKGVTQFYIFHALQKNQWTRCYAFCELSSSSQNLQFIKKCPCLSSLKTKFQELKKINLSMFGVWRIPMGFLKSTILWSVPSISSEVLDLSF